MALPFFSMLLEDMLDHLDAETGSPTNLDRAPEAKGAGRKKVESPDGGGKNKQQ